MSWSNGILQREDSLRVKHGVWSGIPGLIVLALGYAVHQNIDQGLLSQTGINDGNRTVIAFGIMFVGFVWALWRKRTIFYPDGSCDVVRHFLALPIRKHYPRSKIYAIGTGADTSGVTWYGRYWRSYRMEKTTYIGYVLFQDNSWTEIFRCSGDNDFQRRIEIITDFTGLPTRRK